MATFISSGSDYLNLGIFMKPQSASKHFSISSGLSSLRYSLKIPTLIVQAVLTLDFKPTPLFALI